MCGTNHRSPSTTNSTNHRPSKPGWRQQPVSFHLSTSIIALITVLVTIHHLVECTLVASHPSQYSAVNVTSSQANFTTTISSSTTLLLRTKKFARDPVCQICWCSKHNELDCRYRNDQSSAIEAIPLLAKVEEQLLIIEL